LDSQNSSLAIPAFSLANNSECARLANVRLPHAIEGNPAPGSRFAPFACIPATPAPRASSSSSKIRAGGGRSSEFDDSGAVKNDAPAADPSTCAVNGLLAHGRPCGLDDAVPYRLVSSRKSLDGAVRREPPLAPFSLVLVWFLGLGERCGGWGWSHGGK
jgi:hypothetical protein